MKQQKCTKLWMWRYFHILATLENDIFFRIKSVILDSFLITISKIEKPKAIWPINFHSYTQCQFNFLAIISAMHPKFEWNDHIKILIFGGTKLYRWRSQAPSCPSAAAAAEYAAVTEAGAASSCIRAAAGAGRRPQQVTQSQPRQQRGNKALSNASTPS